jgi:hypothetical protein
MLSDDNKCYREKLKNESQPDKQKSMAVQLVLHIVVFPELSTVSDTQ